MSKTYSAVRWTTFSVVLRSSLQVVQLSTLARILAPEDYGLAAMVWVILGFVAAFNDFGLNSAYVQRQDVTPEQRSSLYWLNVGVSLGLTILVIAASPLVAWYFHDGRLVSLVMMSSVTLILGALGQQVKMDSEKALDFRPVVLVEIGGALLGFASAIITALIGWGVYSLIFSVVVGAFSSTALLWIFVARGWRPLWRFKVEDVKPYLGFGVAVVGNSIANRINMSVDLLLGGRLLGATQLGYYSVPRQLMLNLQLMLNPIVTRVGFPLIAKIQDDILQVRTIYLRTLNMTASVSAPLYLAFTFWAPDIVQVLLGKNWSNSIDFLRILAVWGFLRAVVSHRGSLMMGMGRADMALKWNFGFIFVSIPALWMGVAFYGQEGLAWALLSLYVIMFIPGWLFIVRPLCQASLVQYCKSALSPMLIAILALLPAYLLGLFVEEAIFRLFIAFIFGGSFYLALSRKMNSDFVFVLLKLVKQQR
jgi:O-antigen/teichoic acid export membrane protein